jgi:hypothetical protein
MGNAEIDLEMFVAEVRGHYDDQYDYKDDTDMTVELRHDDEGDAYCGCKFRIVVSELPEPVEEIEKDAEAGESTGGQ